jgi:hypothetical protein
LNSVGHALRIGQRRAGDAQGGEGDGYFEHSNHPRIICARASQYHQMTGIIR